MKVNALHDDYPCFISNAPIFSPLYLQCTGSGNLTKLSTCLIRGDDYCNNLLLYLIKFYSSWVTVGGEGRYM